MGTAEQSYYPAINTLLDRLGSFMSPARAVLAHPAGIEGNLPDVALYERASNVLVLPVEAKPAGSSLEALVASAQALRYARVFGGGTVLLTNVREFAVARIGADDRLHIAGRVLLAADEAQLDQRVGADALDGRELQMLIEDACQVRGALSNPATVARLLAFHAGSMRTAIDAGGDSAVLLAPISAALREGLQIDVPRDLLVPTVVQTLVYGLFAAWLESDEPGEFNWMNTAYSLTVPVFADVLHAALRPQLVRASGLTTHLESIARVLAWTDRSAFAAQFDGDAIQYFYEPFLAAFDQGLRGSLGVWYTPREVADYQVARVDHHLKHDLGLEAGLADPTVYILDPATGTGTYLAAALRRIHQTHLDNGEDERTAVARTRDAALTRVIGFEVLPAAFIICHLHIARMLQRLGAAELATTDRLRIYLTNSLTGWSSSDVPVGNTLFPELEEELRGASAVKHIDPVLVVLGNPPYQGGSSAETAEEKQMIAPWISPLWPEWRVRKHRLNDLYVRFWRVALQRIVATTGRGVVSYITNRKWLAGRSYPVMRENIISDFDTVVVDDLHGASDDTSHPGDQSIFTTGVAAGIKRGTAIVTAVRTGPTTSDHVADVRVRDHWGSAADKRAFLIDPNKLESGFETASVSAESWWRLSTRVSGDDAPLDDYLTFYRSGVQPVRDDAVLDVDKARLQQRMEDYFNPDLTFTDLLARHPGFGVTRARYDPAKTRTRLLSISSYQAERVVPVLYRPFDVRWLYWEPEAKLLNEPRRELIPYWRNVPDQRCLVLPQTPRRAGALRPVVTQALAYNEAVEPNARLFPLYRPPTHLLGEAAGELALHDVTDAAADELLSAGRTMVATPWVTAARQALGTDDETAAGEAVFYALVAVMSASTWQALQPAELDDFPDVPLPGAAAELAAAAALGRRIADLTDPTVQVPGVTAGHIDSALARLGVPDPVGGSVDLEYGSYGTRAGMRQGSDVLWAEFAGWRGVPDDVWNYIAGGFTVLPKWLSYRKSTGLRPEDREHFMFLCRRIAALRQLDAECDAAHRAAVDRPLLQL